MAGFDDFMRQRMANTVRGYETGGSGGTLPPAQKTVPITTVPYPSPTPMSASPTPQSELDDLIEYLVASGGLLPDNVYGGYGSPSPLPAPPVQASIPGVNPNPVLDPSSQPYHGYPGSVQPGNMIDGDGTAGPRSRQSELDALVDDARNKYTGEHFEDGSSTPSRTMSAQPQPTPSSSPVGAPSGQRGPMNPIQQAAAVALMRMKGVI